MRTGPSWKWGSLGSGLERAEAERLPRRAEVSSLERRDATPNDLPAQRGGCCPRGPWGTPCSGPGPALEHREEEQGALRVRYRVPADMDAEAAMRWRDDVYRAEAVPRRCGQSTSCSWGTCTRSPSRPSTCWPTVPSWAAPFRGALGQTGPGSPYRLCAQGGGLREGSRREASPRGPALHRGRWLGRHEWAMLLVEPCQQLLEKWWRPSTAGHGPPGPLEEKAGLEALLRVAGGLVRG